MIRRDLAIPKASPTGLTWYTDPATLFNAPVFRDFLAHCIASGIIDTYDVTQDEAQVKILIEYAAPDRFGAFLGALRTSFPKYEQERDAYMAASGVVPQPVHYKPPVATGTAAS